MNTKARGLFDQECKLFDQQLTNLDKLKADSTKISRICGGTAVTVLLISLVLLRTNQLLAASIAVGGFVLCGIADTIISAVLSYRCSKENKALDAQCDDLLAQIDVLVAAEPKPQPVMAVHLRLHPKRQVRKSKKKRQVVYPTWYPTEYIQYLNS